MDSCIAGNATSGHKYTTIYHKGKMVLHHRLAYAQAHGLDVFTLDGIVMHSCDNPKCVNPAHLSLGTSKANSEDMVNKGRSGAGVKNSQSKLTPEQVEYVRNTYVPRSKDFGGVVLAKLFNVSKDCISCIVLDKKWRT